jgi:hypothetical protein
MLVPILHDKPFKGGEAEYISDLVRFGLFWSGDVITIGIQVVPCLLQTRIFQ